VTKQRKHFSPEEKASILGRHLLNKVPVSTICEEAGIQPSLFYQWQKQFFQNGAAAFQLHARRLPPGLPTPPRRNHIGRRQCRCPPPWPAQPQDHRTRIETEPSAGYQLE
jgi:transposase-like protein